MAKPQDGTKWKGEIIEEIKNVTPQQLWALLADFCSLNNLFLNVDKCYLLEGVPGEVGLIRWCESSAFSGAQVQYAKEKLVMFEPSKMRLAYEVIESNVGFKEYVATMQVCPTDRDDDGGSDGCKFVWTIVCDPVDDFTQEGLFGLLRYSAKAMVKNVEAVYSRN